MLNAMKVLADRLARLQRLRADNRQAGAASLPRSLALSDGGSTLAMTGFFVRFSTDEGGVTAIEYGLIGALISVVCVAGVTLVGAQLQAMYAAISAAITPAL